MSARLSIHRPRDETRLTFERRNVVKSDMVTERVSEFRVSYDAGDLLEGSMAADPFTQFARWLTDAVEGGLPEPNAMVLATADEAGHPSARTVLLKDIDPRGFTFFTNLTSRKSGELSANPYASVVFPWFAMHRQVVVIGSIELVDRPDVETYFRSRPRDSQIGAWVSRQSEVLPDRTPLEQRLAELTERFGDADVPVPEFWGGWRLLPVTVEFWHGRTSRLHDRLRYRSVGQGRLDHADDWVLERLSP